MSSSSSSPSSRRLLQRVSLKEIEAGTENFDERYAQGQGKGKFYIARIMLGRTEITQAAVKRLKPNSSGFEDEIQIMPNIQHPNIVSLLGYCDDSGQKILIYEHMANGSLANYLWKTQEPTATSSLSWQQRLKICLDAALGLENLHTRMKEGVYLIHGEIKPDNILLDANWVAKIFCSSVFEVRPSIAQRASAVRTGKGDHYAPEYVSYQHTISIKTDVYAFGMMLFQVLCGRMSKGGKPPHCWYYDDDLRDWAKENVDSKIFREISHNSLLEFTHIILHCMTEKRYERPTMGEVRFKLQNVLERQEREDLEAATKVEGSRKCQRISLKEIEDATEKFDKQYALGHGGEATVYSAQIMLGRGLITRVAVKHLKPNSSSFEAEIQIMPKIQHPNIVSLLGYCNDSGQKILIYEYMANGSLADFLQKKQKPTAIDTTTSSLSWQQRLKICVGAALGLKHLHAETKEFAKGIIHRDIKPANILLDANWVAKISDFGMFKVSRVDQIDSMMSTMLKGTRGYLAPEYFNFGHVTRKIDVFSFGVVMFQLMCRKMPLDRGDESYFDTEDEDLGLWARQNVDPEIRGEVSDYCLNAFTGIIQKCLSLDPKKRPTMDEVALTLQMLWNASSVRTI